MAIVLITDLIAGIDETLSSVVPGPHAVAAAFSRSAELALMSDVAIVVLALLLVLGLPRQIPDRRR